MKDLCAGLFCLYNTVMTLSELFTSFQFSAFRLEGQATYVVEEEAEALKLHQNTGQLPEEFGTEWVEFVRNQRRLGKKIQRLRLLSDVLSEYERFELKAYTGMNSGEGIRFTKRSNQPYEYDFWLFDDRWLARMEYGDDGRYITSTISAVTSENREIVDDWLALYHAAPSISEIAPVSK